MAASTDGAVLVWDVPAACLLQTMRISVDYPVMGLSLSPSMDMLATVHEGRRGVYLWANSQMYTPAAPALSAAEEDSTGAREGDEVVVELPRLHAEADDGGEIVLGASISNGEDEPEGAPKKAEGQAADKAHESSRAEAPEPVSPGMATMALLPRTQWLGLLHLDTIRERNKPIAPPEKPKEAPFFLPTTASLERNPVFDVEAKTGDEDEGEDGQTRSRILKTSGEGGGDVEGVLLRLLRRGKAAAEAAAKNKPSNGKKRGAATSAEEPSTGGVYAELLVHLRKQGPSALDAEIRALGPWDVAVMSDADEEELADVLDFFAAEIPSGRNFELLHALLAHFLRVHGLAIAARESLRERADRVRAAARGAWKGLDALLQEVRCALGFFSGQHG